MTSHELIDALLLKNRTIATSDMHECMSLIGAEIPLVLHRYPSGSEYGTWLVPDEWKVVRAELRGSRGVLASYADHPLFVAPYSCAFSGRVTRDELLRRTISSPHVPDGFSYQYRLAYDCSRRLKDWALTLPHSILERLDEPEYQVDIEIETRPGEMLVAESTLEGETPYTIAFLSHLCHPGQANDGLAGIVLGMEWLRRIERDFPKRRYTYQLLIMPETIGSAVFLESHPDRIANYLGAFFCEMPGADGPMQLAHSRRGSTYLDRVFVEALARTGVPCARTSFFNSVGNDERMFDSPGVGIPALALDRYPFRAYHTSEDTTAEVRRDKLDEVMRVLIDAVSILERDCMPRARQRVPVYLSRYGLYADFEHDRGGYDLNQSLHDRLWADASLLETAQELGLPFERARAWLDGFTKHGLVDERPITPAYARENRPSSRP